MVSEHKTKECPIYTAFIVDGDTTYDINPILISVNFVEDEGEMAQRATVTIKNILINGVWSTSVFQCGQRVFIYADDGEKKDEVFNGFIWKKNYKSSNKTREYQLFCYDKMIYLQESEDYVYMPPGKKSEDVVKKIAEDWGIKLKYEYESITHEQLVLKGSLSDIIMGDVLDKVRDHCGKKYVIRMEKDTLHIVTVGENKKIYQLLQGYNVSATESDETMDGMITKVVIFGKQGDGKRAPVEATVEANTKKYGTIQKVVSKNEGSSLADAKKEAETILKMSKWPFRDYVVTGPDIPWIRKGDVVYVNAGDIYQQHLICKSVDRHISNRGAEMVLKLNNGLPRTYQTQHLSGSISQETPKQDAGGTLNDGTVSASQQAVINAAYNTPSAGYNLCATWVRWVFNKVGIAIWGNGNDMTNAYCHSSDRGQLKPGMVIGVVRSPFGSAGAKYGHIAIYVGGGKVLSCELGKIATYTLDGFISTYGPPGGSQVRWGWADNKPLA